MFVTCANCHQEIEVPAELIGDNFEPDHILPYICDECEAERDEAADERDHEFIQPVGLMEKFVTTRAALETAIEQLESRNLDLCGDVGRLSAIAVVALDLLRRFVQQSREPDEGDCVYCNCELGSGNEYHCYNDCIITEVRKLLDAVEKGQSVQVDRAVLHDLQENNWSIPEHEDEF